MLGGGSRSKKTENGFGRPLNRLEKESGKSRLAYAIASVLRRFDWRIIAFDNAGVYRKISDIGYIIRVLPLSRPNARIPHLTDFLK